MDRAQRDRIFIFTICDQSDLARGCSHPVFVGVATRAVSALIHPDLFGRAWLQPQILCTVFYARYRVDFIRHAQRDGFACLLADPCLLSAALRCMHALSWRALPSATSCRTLNYILFNGLDRRRVWRDLCQPDRADHFQWLLGVL